MIISKQGYDHFIYDINNQDNAFQDGLIKVVTDGCSSGKHSELGCKLFELSFKKTVENYIGNEQNNILYVYLDIMHIFRIYPSLEIDAKKKNIIYEYLMFTNLILHEDNDMFWLFYNGDGVVILQDEKGVDFLEINDGYEKNTPRYYIYKFINENEVGMEMKTMGFPKNKYKRVGIASDGICYLFKMDEALQYEFKEYLMNDEEIKIRRFINKYREKFKDDVSLIW